MSDNKEHLSNANYWEFAAERYQLLKSPLIPSDDDLQCVEQIANRFNHPLEILQLGVTPALVNASWPDQSHLVSIDHSQQMIQHIWPGESAHSSTRREARLKDWLQLDPNDGKYDLIIGDGAFNNISTHHDLPILINNLHHILQPGGKIAQRVFITLDPPSSPEAIIDKLKHDQFTNFHAFKWSLVMSLQSSPGDGITLNDIWDYWKQAIPDPNTLIHSTRWSSDVYQTIEMYRSQYNRFYFPTLDQLISVVEKHFCIEKTVFQPYDLGEQCPTLIFSKKLS